LSLELRCRTAWEQRLLGAGVLLAALAAAAGLAWSDGAPWWTWTALAAVPTLVTGVLEWGLGWPLSNVVRAVAALPLGFAVAFVVVSAVATLHYE